MCTDRRVSWQHTNFGQISLNWLLPIPQTHTPQRMTTDLTQRLCDNRNYIVKFTMPAIYGKVAVHDSHRQWKNIIISHYIINQSISIPVCFWFLSDWIHFLCYLFHSSCKFNQTHFYGSYIDACVFMLYWLLTSSTVCFYFTPLLFKFWATERGFILWVCN